MTRPQTLSDRQAVALTLFGEVRGEGLEGQIAVASVLRNRLLDGRWGRSYAAVCLAPWQFSCWNDADPNRPRLDALAAQLADPHAPAPADPALQRCLWLADGLVAGVLPSTVKRATHYYAVAIRETPRWAKAGALVGRVGNHLFFERVP